MAPPKDIDPTAPADTQVVADYPADERGNRQVIEDLIAQDHAEGASYTNAQAGKHLQVSLLQRGSDPTVPADEGAVYVKDVSGNNEVFWKDEAGNVIQVTSLGTLRGELVALQKGNKATRDGISSPHEGMMFLRTDIDPGAIDVYESAAWVRRVGPRVGQVEIWTGSVAVTTGYLDARPGWALCNGDTVNGYATPNLSGRFVVGYNPADADYLAIAETGGEKTHTLTEAELAAHDHKMFKWETPGAHSNLAEQGDSVISTSVNTGGDATYRLGESTGTRDTGDTSEEGGGDPHENRPPYYTVAYIVFVDVA